MPDLRKELVLGEDVEVPFSFGGLGGTFAGTCFMAAERNWVPLQLPVSVACFQPPAGAADVDVFNAPPLLVLVGDCSCFSCLSSVEFGVVRGACSAVSGSFSCCGGCAGGGC